MILQAIHDISEICASKGVRYAVLSPGSRCAPLTISFARNKAVHKFTFPDERSAAFQALGMASATNSPVVLVCTSGSAAYNYAPAVAEAYYQQIPLLILTADRPPEWIDQLDGQTIRQQEIYGKHVKKSFTLPDNQQTSEAYWHTNRIVNEAINIAKEYPKGPVHINVPIREPFYPVDDEQPEFSRNIRIINAIPPQSDIDAKQYAEKISQFDKVLVVPGQGDYDHQMIKTVDRFCEVTHSTLAADVISNFHEAQYAIRHQDLFINQKTPLPESYKPSLLITFGKSLISKNLKLFLRQCSGVTHWHLSETSHSVADTFQHLTDIISCDPVTFFRSVTTAYQDRSDFDAQKKQNYRQAWSITDKRTEETLKAALKSGDFHELKVIADCLLAIPDNSSLLFFCQ